MNEMLARNKSDALLYNGLEEQIVRFEGLIRTIQDGLQVLSNGGSRNNCSFSNYNKHNKDMADHILGTIRRDANQLFEFVGYLKTATRALKRINERSGFFFPTDSHLTN